MRSLWNRRSIVADAPGQVLGATGRTTTQREEGGRKLSEDEGDDGAVWRATKMLELHSLLDTVIDSCKRAAKTIEEIPAENA